MAAESTVVGDVIDQRLDALDRALLGLLPRSERLAVVADVEARVRDTHGASPTVAELLASPADEPAVGPAASRTPRRARRRSVLALTSGVIGIAALVLLFIMPLTYLVVAMTSEAIGEVASYVLLSANVVVVALGGAAAVVMGITSLVRLSRRQGTQRGHGWAITALCTGPLPALIGGLATITIVLPMLAEVASAGGSTGPVYATMPVASDSCTVCPAPGYASPAVELPPPLMASAPASGWAPASNNPAPAANYPAPAFTGPSYQPGTAAAPALTPAESPGSGPSLPSAPAPASLLPTLTDGTEPAAETTPTTPTVPLNPLPKAE